MDYCIVVYNGKDQPSHLKDAFRLKGTTFATGKEQEVTADLAAKLLRSAPKDSVKVIKGEPKESPVLSGTAKEAARRIKEHREMFPVDPAKSLEGIPVLSAKALGILQQKDQEKALASIAAGELDEDLATAAFTAHLLRKPELAAALARRKG